MVDRKATVTLPDGKVIEGVDVPVVESNEKWSEFTLADGAVMRVKMNMFSFVRVPDQFDADGNMLYVGKGAPVSTPVSVPDRYRRKPQ